MPGSGVASLWTSKEHDDLRHWTPGLGSRHPSTSGRAVIHLGAGWSAYEGTETLCGGRLKYVDSAHLVESTTNAMAQAFPGLNLCPKCQRKVDKERR